MLDYAAAVEVERHSKLKCVERAQAVAGGKPADQFPGYREVTAGDTGKLKFSVCKVPIKPFTQDLCLLGCDRADAKLPSDCRVKLDL